MRRIAALALAAVATLVAGAAFAQRDGGRGGEPGAFDFYVLALSWSPAFCEATGDARGSRQCDAGRGLRFVVHGLWPQNERGFPIECGSGPRSLPRAAADEAASVFPEEGLARHQWRRHGTCSGLGPAEWVSSVRTARDKVRVPEALAELTREGETSPVAIERAFAEANPGLRGDMMAVQCARGALQEVRICLSRDLREFRPCPEVDRRSCRGGTIRVDPPR